MDKYPTPDIYHNLKFDIYSPAFNEPDIKTLD